MGEQWGWASKPGHSSCRQGMSRSVQECCPVSVSRVKLRG